MNEENKAENAATPSNQGAQTTPAVLKSSAPEPAPAPQPMPAPEPAPAPQPMPIPQPTPASQAMPQAQAVPPQAQAIPAQTAQTVPPQAMPSYYAATPPVLTQLSGGMKFGWLVIGLFMGIPGMILAWLVNVDKFQQVKSDAVKFAVIGFVINIVAVIFVGFMVSAIMTIAINQIYGAMTYYM